VKRRLCLAAALTVLASPSPAPASAQSRMITMSGASPLQALVADLAFFYRRETPRAPRFALVGGGTGTGIADAARGIVDAGMSGRALAPGDPSGLVFTPLALSAVCVVTNVANPVPSLSRAQIQDLVAGRLRGWAQVGGSRLRDPIAPVSFDLTSGARAVFLSAFVDLETPLAYEPRTFSATAQVHDFILVTPAAWGYLDLAHTRGLHTVAFEGIACSATGAYPARRQLGLVTRGKPRGALKRFLRWVGRDATAKRVIRTRYVAAGQ
jgi:phosphate transport system substrate-binding protein